MGIKELDFGKGRPRAADYITICRNIADSYTMGIPHGVQKDAVQNGFHTAGKKQPLKFVFELVRNTKGEFFTMTDSNTKGLMGEVLNIDEYEKIDDANHWARFEAFGFTSVNPDAIGARGQGKFIFLAASKDYTMLYDSLRCDGTYRLGITKATKTDCPMLHWDGNEGSEKLGEFTNIEPLKEVGTRIIIINPIDELVEEVKNGAFLSSIEETWFRAIEKNRAEIYVKYDGKKQIAKVPAPFPVPQMDSSKFKIWGKHNHEISLVNWRYGSIGGTGYRIKHLCIGYKVDGGVEEPLRGVAIIHHGMKITSIQMDEAPSKIKNSIFGYVDFDRELDRELRKNYNQNPNHYDLNWRRQIPRAIKEFVLSELRQFGCEKLGLGIDPRERRKQIRTTAEIEALKYLSRYAKELDLFSRKQGSGGRRRRKQSGHPSNKQIGVMLRNFNFPESERAPRVNWGEEIRGFDVEIFNKTRNNLKGQLRVFILFGDREIAQVHDERDISITPLLKKPMSFGPFSIAFSKSIFPDPGEYRLRVRLVNQESHAEIDCLARKIWVEKDPPFHWPFEPLPDDFSNKGDIAKRQWITAGILGEDPFLYYNIAHPAYKRVEYSEVELSNYLFEVFLEGSMDFILNRPEREDGTPDYHPLDNEKITKDPKDAYFEISGKIAEIRSKYYEGI